MSKYEGVDFYNLDQHLTEEELMVRDLVRDWVDEEVLPIIEDYYTKGTFPLELIPRLVKWDYLVAICQVMNAQVYLM